MKGIYRFHWNCGRSGSLDAIFVADASEVASAIGKELYFGEVLGKHSEISGTLESDDVKLISDTTADVEAFERLKLETGLNPLQNLSEEEEDESEEVEE